MGREEPRLARSALRAHRRRSLLHPRLRLRSTGTDRAAKARGRPLRTPTASRACGERAQAVVVSIPPPLASGSRSSSTETGVTCRWCACACCGLPASAPPSASSRGSARRSLRRRLHVRGGDRTGAERRSAGRGAAGRDGAGVVTAMHRACRSRWGPCARAQGGRRSHSRARSSAAPAWRSRARAPARGATTAPQPAARDRAPALAPEARKSGTASRGGGGRACGLPAVCPPPPLSLSTRTAARASRARAPGRAAVQRTVLQRRHRHQIQRA